MLKNDKLPERESFEVLDEGTYQVVIADINDHEGKNFNTGEPEAQYVIDLVVLDEEKAGHKLKVWCTTKYGAAKSGRKESKLFTIVSKAMKKIVPVNEVSLSALIGKQITVVISKYESESGFERNKILSFMEAKTELPVPENIKLFMEADKTEETAGQKAAKGESPTDESISLDDIPF